MTKKEIIIVSCVIFIMFFLLFFSFLSERFYEPIAVLENINYGMSPQNIIEILGDTQEKSLSDEKTWMWYKYPAIIENKNCDISLGFFRSFIGWKLFSVQVEYSNISSSNDKTEFEQIILTKFRQAYSDNNCYYETKEQGQVNVGLNYGATNVSCTIKQTEVGVTVRCQKVK